VDGAKRRFGLTHWPTIDLALDAGWNEELVALEIAELQEIGFDIDLIGFTTSEIAAFGSQANYGLTDPDAAPEPPLKPVSVSTA
jgi:hypothetical protein